MKSQLTRADLASMTPEAIDEAHREGRFDTVLGHDRDYLDLVERAGGLVGPADITALRQAGREDLVVRALDEDRINFDNDKEPA